MGVNKMTPSERVARTFGPFAVHVNDLPAGHPTGMAANLIGEQVTALVGNFATVFPNAAINRLMRQVWHLFGSSTAFVALDDRVKTPSVAIMAVGNRDMATVMLIPPNWPESAAKDPVMAGGALVFCGSQVVDAYNDRLVGRVGALSLARAYEAEYLLTIRAADPAWVPDAYQTGILTMFPGGVTSGLGATLTRHAEDKPVPVSPPPPRDA